MMTADALTAERLRRIARAATDPANLVAPMPALTRLASELLDLAHELDQARATPPPPRPARRRRDGGRP